MKKNICLLISLILALLLFSSCSIIYPIPNGYPELSEEIYSHIIFSVTFTGTSTTENADLIDTWGVYEDISGNYILDVADENDIIMQFSSIIKGSYDNTDEDNNLTLYYDVNDYIYESTDTNCSFSITIDGNASGYIWGTFTATLLEDGGTDYAEITSGKFSAVIED